MGHESKIAAEAEIAKRLIRYSVDTERLGANLSQRALVILKQLQSELVALLAKHDIEPGDLSGGKWKSLLKGVETLINERYGDVSAETHHTLRSFAEFEPAAIATVIERGINAAVNVTVDLTLPRLTPEMVEAAADAIIEGAPLSEWWGRQSREVYEKFADTMRQGFLQGTSYSDLIRTIRGTREAGYTDGIMQARYRDAVTLTRTSLNSVANDARMRLYAENTDIINGVELLVTLDRRTSEICRPRATCKWDLQGKPLPGSPCQYPWPGPPPYHPRCRTTVLSLLRSWKDILGHDVEEFTSTRTARDQAGKSVQVPQDWTYSDWLKTQSEEVQRDVLGRGKYKLWNSGKLSLTDMVDQSGNPLTLRDIQSRLKAGTYN